MTYKTSLSVNIPKLFALLALLFSRFISDFRASGVASRVYGGSLRLGVAKHILCLVGLQVADSPVVVLALARLGRLQSVESELLVVVGLVELVADGHVAEQRSH